MAGRVPPTTFERITTLERSTTMKQSPFVITASVVIVILVAALATLGALSAFAGQKSGLEQAGLRSCPHLGVKAARDVADPGYGARL
jgi:hypothetical protein